MKLQLFIMVYVRQSSAYIAKSSVYSCFIYFNSMDKLCDHIFKLIFKNFNAHLMISATVVLALELLRILCSSIQYVQFN